MYTAYSLNTRDPFGVAIDNINTATSSKNQNKLNPNTHSNALRFSCSLVKAIQLCRCVPSLCS